MVAAGRDAFIPRLNRWERLLKRTLSVHAVLAVKAVQEAPGKSSNRGLYDDYLVSSGRHIENHGVGELILTDPRPRGGWVSFRFLTQKALAAAAEL
jgi:hypothetical protein